MDWQQLTNSLAASGSAAVTLSAFLVTQLVQFVISTIKLRKVKELEFQEALATDSLRKLGDYLDRAVGQFSVSEYAHNPEVRNKVNMILARVEDFVGKTEEITSARPTAPPATSVVGDSGDMEIQAAEERIFAGNVWDGLAHLRRVIEQRLRERALDIGVTISERAGATRLLEALRRKDAVAEDVAESLRYVISVCNRGVHGLPVTTNEAVHAVSSARWALREMGLS